MLGDEDQLEFRGALTRFVRTYSFGSQICRFTDPDLERDYVFCRALSLYLRDADTTERLDLGTAVGLTRLPHQMTYSGELGLNSDVDEVQSFFGTGTGGQQQLELETLSSIVEPLNDRLGTDFSEADQLLFDQFHADPRRGLRRSHLLSLAWDDGEAGRVADPDDLSVTEVSSQFAVTDDGECDRADPSSRSRSSPIGGPRGWAACSSRA